MTHVAMYLNGKPFPTLQTTPPQSGQVNELRMPNASRSAVSDRLAREILASISAAFLIASSC
jgi:hypothetical protein